MTRFQLVLHSYVTAWAGWLQVWPLYWRSKPDLKQTLSMSDHRIREPGQIRYLVGKVAQIKTQK